MVRPVFNEVPLYDEHANTIKDSTVFGCVTVLTPLLPLSLSWCCSFFLSNCCVW